MSRTEKPTVFLGPKDYKPGRRTHMSLQIELFNYRDGLVFVEDKDGKV